MANDISNFPARPAKMAMGSDMESVLLMMHVLKEQMDSMQSMIKGRANEINDMKDYMAGFEKLIRRRFDEVSMEINATSQQLDMAEEGMGGRFAEILNNLAAISFHGDGHTAANTGVELEAVIADSERAANTILDATDQISARLRNTGNLEDESEREQFLMDIESKVQDILMACTFQDLTGQRVRKTLESLELIEERIETALGQMGIESHADAQAGGVEDSTKGHATSQDDIDALFA